MLKHFIGKLRNATPEQYMQLVGSLSEDTLKQIASHLGLSPKLRDLPRKLAIRRALSA